MTKPLYRGQTFGPIPASLTDTMKAVIEKQNKVRDDFYSSTLAPVNQRRDLRFKALDVFILTVLFLEAGVLIRLFLAK